MKEKFQDKYKKLGLNIAYYRKLCGLTQEQLAEKLDLDRTTVSKIELAAVGVSLDVIFEMAEVFGITPEKLFEIR
jgi:transcriptional regulator with XRE-family HTH domain